jgi:hypothetical protein
MFSHFEAKLREQMGDRPNKSSFHGSLPQPVRPPAAVSDRVFAPPVTLAQSTAVPKSVAAEALTHPPKENLKDGSLVSDKPSEGKASELPAASAKLQPLVRALESCVDSYSQRGGGEKDPAGVPQALPGILGLDTWWAEARAGFRADQRKGLADFARFADARMGKATGLLQQRFEEFSQAQGRLAREAKDVALQSQVEVRDVRAKLIALSAKEDARHMELTAPKLARGTPLASEILTASSLTPDASGGSSSAAANGPPAKTISQSTRTNSTTTTNPTSIISNGSSKNGSSNIISNSSSSSSSSSSKLASSATASALGGLPQPQPSPTPAITAPSPGHAGGFAFAGPAQMQNVIPAGYGVPIPAQPTAGRGHFFAGAPGSSTSSFGLPQAAGVHLSTQGPASSAPNGGGGGGFNSPHAPAAAFQAPFPAGQGSSAMMPPTQNSRGGSAKIAGPPVERQPASLPNQQVGKEEARSVSAGPVTGTRPPAQPLQQPQSDNSEMDGYERRVRECVSACCCR